MPVQSITPELVVAYWFCQRKAFFLLRGDTGEPPHEYTKLVDALAATSLDNFLDALRTDGFDVRQSEDTAIVGNADVIARAALKVGDLEATVDALVRIQHGSLEARGHYEPHLVAGTHAITREQKIRLAVLGHVFAKAYRHRVAAGVIVNVAGDTSRVQLTKPITELGPIIDPIKMWQANLPFEPPPIILKDHCPICPYRKACLDEAEKDDNLSLLDRMTPKVMRKYHGRGIFTVNQLSYLFRPRRQRAIRTPVVSRFSFELQALALRTSKIYVHEPPSIPEHPTEIFLDIEGVPDRGDHYLIGVIVSDEGHVGSHSLWADSAEDERDIFAALLRITKDHPEAPIYHYGSYEPKALERVAKKYDLPCDSVARRLVNVNSFIFGKVYFPARSNTLKALGKCAGATWSSSDASGLQSLVWRLQWEASKDCALKDQILAYNLEDCQALQLLVTELRSIGHAAADRSDVDFADAPKQNTTTSGQHIHDSLEWILRSAHADYRRNRIGIQKRKPDEETARKGRGAPKGHQGFWRIAPAKVGKGYPSQTPDQMSPAQRSTPAAI